MTLAERLITERITQLKADLREAEAELLRVRSITAGPSSTVAVSARQQISLNALVREALSAAPSKFSTSFIRDYVTTRMPGVKRDSLNASIARILMDARSNVRPVQSGSGQQPSEYEKLKLEKT